ncbi:hypothetical protein G7Y89_g11077 [Cudoniella acicularis]|uniref:Uncharacterized protein n=1 Tax=Cudoniella acicularis TaxID=354080 RepID=A0A8H4RBJ4_9HELO|nr:hypothetical protein G7Y89_g11077 [Cudoniella acicularis]
MVLVNIRELLAFPQGDNSSDTLIGGIHWNLTTLNYWNYTYYSNGTFSNGSLCFLLFEPYTPYLLQNGTFLNSTSCYSPIEPIRTRAAVGIVFACLFAFSIMFTFINLRKHGRLFLPSEKRFVAIGRRWQWYWMLMVAAFAMISGITGVDVDRYYLPELPIVLSNFFWFLMLPTTMAVVWESVRHWGSWQERQMIDPNPFSLRQDDRRGKVELYLPLIFYLCAWLNFFMIVPRAWGAIELQRDPDQARLRAEPTATDVRFKAAAFLLFCGWLTTVFSLQHSIKHYKPRNRGIFNRIIGLIRYTPPKFLLTLPLSLVMIGYEAACAFDFSISPLNYQPNLAFVYGLGWTPIALIFLVYEVAGYLDPNEDRELLRQRRVRGAEADQEIGITKKPHWWSRLHGDNRQMNVHDQIAQNVSQIGGGRPTTTNLERSIEMGNMPVTARQQQNKPSNEAEAIRLAANLLFPTTNTNVETQERFTDTPGAGRGRSPGDRSSTLRNETRTGTSDRSDSSNSGITIGAQPQQFTYSHWDLCAIAKLLEHGLRPLPTKVYPENKPRHFTLTTKSQEAFTILWQNWENVGVGKERSVEERMMHPDVHPKDPDAKSFYYPEVPTAWMLLQHLMPSVLYIWGFKSMVANEGHRQETRDWTGSGYLGSGGVELGRVEERIANCGHNPAMEAIEETAGYCVDRVIKEIERSRVEEEMVSRNWEGKTGVARQVMDERLYSPTSPTTYDRT